LRGLGFTDPIDYVERMLRNGVSTINPLTAPVIQACFLASINRFNADPRVVNGQIDPVTHLPYVAIPQSVAAQKIAELQARNGFYNMIPNYRYEPIYQWYLNLLGVS